MKREVAYTEYSVEVNNENGFVRQIDIFQTIEEAQECAKSDDIKLEDGEYINIIWIDYDKNGDEIGFGSMV